jgi:hypothetical protein
MTLMGRMHAEGSMPAGIKNEFAPVIGRFLAAARKALPDLPEPEFYLRLRAAGGAMAFTMLGAPADSDDLSRRIRSLIVFLSGGLRAPVAAPEKKVEVTK